MGNQGYFSDGKTRNFTAPAGGVLAGELYRVDGWNHVCEKDTAAGKVYAGNIDPTYVFYISVPGGVTANAGDVLYLPPAGGTITNTATSNVAAAKVYEAQDGNNIVGVRVLNNS